MADPMREDEMRHFIDTVAATAIANKALAALSIARLPLTAENATQAYGKWINPNTPHFERLVLMVNAQIEEILATAALLSAPASGNA